MAPEYTFRVSTKRTKKYDAVFDNGRVVSFGAYDHNDPKRRERYFQRHKVSYPMYSADGWP
jgi:hypothetical protein